MNPPSRAILNERIGYRWNAVELPEPPEDQVAEHDQRGDRTTKHDHQEERGALTEAFGRPKES